MNDSPANRRLVSNDNAAYALAATMAPMARAVVIKPPPASHKLERGMTTGSLVPYQTWRRVRGCG
jgi:hypothetical protein